MKEESRKFLSDIFRAIEKIEEYNLGINDFEAYKLDDKAQSATERQLGIIGDALRKYRTTASKDVGPDDQLVISFRNRLIHAYDDMDNTIVWAVLQKHIPVLKTKIQQLLFPE